MRNFVDMDTSIRAAQIALRLRELQGEKDTEAAHSEADNLTCELIELFGYKVVAEEFRKVKKWCA